VGSNVTEFVFNAAGQRVSEWNASTEAQTRGQYYWGSIPVGFYNPGSNVHFQHQNWLGTERVQTGYSGAIEGQFGSLPFGDAQQTTGSGDPELYATLDYDSETNTDHAQFRQYSLPQGHWMSPDPYSGSYDTSPK
jgi:hypothetical protein